MNFSWNKVLAHIVALDDVQIAPNRMKDKDRSLIKERFAVNWNQLLKIWLFLTISESAA